MNYIKSTYEVLAFKVLNRDVNDSWIEWAIQMVCCGYETEHLIILAGVSKPYNQFYLQDLTSKVFSELSLDITSQEKVLRNYSAYLANEALDGNRSYREVLHELKDICIELDYEKSLFDFYLLFFALDALEFSKDQGYWPDATRKNINSVLTEYFKNWIKEQEELC
ncbi:MAG TPA: hypothetical protein VG605_22460 [Puia sp.]|nr:hypothetical protein [Puia sp.]